MERKLAGEDSDNVIRLGGNGQYAEPKIRSFHLYGVIGYRANGFGIQDRVRLEGIVSRGDRSVCQPKKQGMVGGRLYFFRSDEAAQAS